MFKRAVLVISLLACEISLVHARSIGDNPDPIRIAPKIGFTYQHTSYVEGGLLVYKDIGPEGFFLLRGGFAGFYFGGEIHPEAGNRIGGFRTGMEAHYALFGGRIGTALLTDFHGRGSLQFSMEGGLSFFGWAYVMAGYNATLTHREFMDISGFKLSVGINFNFWHQIVDD